MICFGAYNNYRFILHTEHSLLNRISNQRVSYNRRIVKSLKLIKNVKRLL
jgi:hypothetical protein